MLCLFTVTKESVKKSLEMKVTDPVNYLLLLSLSCHPLKRKVELHVLVLTRYERKTLARTDCRTPSHRSELTSITYKSVYNDLHILKYISMNFFKKMLGFGKGLDDRIKEFKVKGTLFEVVKQTRNLK